MASVVRASKYRHVFGTTAKREDSFENLRVATSAWDSNFVTANPKYVAVNWAASGGGAFCIVPQALTGKLRGDFPVFSAHQGAVLDTAFSPFDDNVIASAAEDHQVMIWRVPEDLEEREEDVTEPIKVLRGHGRKVGHVAWNPVAEGVLAASSSDNTVRIWDVESAEVRQTLGGFGDTVMSIAWSPDGTQLAATCRDKKLRIFDARTGRVEHEAASHTGIKGSRVVWLGADRLATTGFSRTSGREVWVWDAALAPVTRMDVDTSAGMLMPFYDAGTRVLYVAGKGDGNIRYYEFADDKLHFLSELQSPEPQRGLGVLPRRGIDVPRCEVMRFYKVASNSLVEPISFRVPRKAESFQSDIYPPAHAGCPSLSAEEYFAGKCAQPKMVDMEVIYRDGPLVVGAGAPPVQSSAFVTVSAPVSVSAPVAQRSTPASQQPTPAPRSPAPERQSPVSQTRTPASQTQTPASQNQTPQRQPSPAPEPAELISLREETARLQLALNQAQKAATDASTRERTTQQQLDDASRQLSEHEQTARKLQAQIDAGVSADQLHAVESKLQAAVDDADSLRVDLDRASTQAEEYRRKLEQATNKASEHEKTSAGLQKDLQTAIQAANALALAAEKAVDNL
ncbi:Coronin-like protein crn1 [Coemansia sp. RSA 921]|nr:Coronin-like protein crn1 [Coemansia sp. RSA 921]KAJ2182930.1 Coronin-like protein crn1 [Coemansia sp. RSA 551]KAJ2274803.1 Coronin-like protein crn1 [Coemansia sp. RSA 451]KAJ2532461.1 Coronin-like protein crn1 [Coemansia sp. RSA 1937]